MSSLKGVTLLTLPILIACSANSGSENNLAVPSYAGPGDRVDVFIVNCGNVRTAVRGQVKYLFYTEAGELKSREEFCREETSSSNIRR